MWFMRQAGRSLPEYRELRKRYGLFDIVAEPELCAEVTLQPVRRHDVDAAVMFTDIMFPVLAMGIQVDLVENVGPVIAEPVRSLADVERLVVPEPEESVPFICECADPACVEIVQMTMKEYREIREDPRTFLNVPGHEASAQGWAQVIESHDRYVGDPADPGVADELGIQGQEPCWLFRIPCRGGLPFQQRGLAVQGSYRIEVSYEVVPSGEGPNQLDLHIA